MNKRIGWKELQKLINYERAYKRHIGNLGRVKNGWAPLDITCIYHNDKSHGTLYVNVNNGVYHCFSCGTSVSLPKLLSDLENISFREALETLEREVYYG